MMYDRHRYDWLKPAMQNDKFKKKASILLKPREYEIVFRLFAKIESRESVSESLCVTKERVRQILSMAEFKLRRMMDANGSARRKL